MQIAIQEDMLPGSSPLEKFEHARRLGLQGVEFWGHDLTYRVPEVMDALQQTGLKAAAVNYGRQGRFLDPHPIERERALTALRQAMMDAHDLGAVGVVFVPEFFGTLPDLTPYKSKMELQAGLLVWHLRTLSDLAYAMDVNLYMEPANRYETDFMTTLEQATRIRTQVKDHPHVLIAASLFHMALEEDDPAQTLRDHAGGIGYIHLADSNRRLPGQGTTNFAAIGAALQAVGYQGWVTLECGEPGENQRSAARFAEQLPASLDVLQRAGFGAWASV